MVLQKSRQALLLSGMIAVVVSVFASAAKATDPSDPGNEGGGGIQLHRTPCAAPCPVENKACPSDKAACCCNTTGTFICSCIAPSACVGNGAGVICNP